MPVSDFLKEAYTIDFRNLTILECGGSASETKDLSNTNHCYYIEAHYEEYKTLYDLNYKVYNYALTNTEQPVSFTITSHRGNSSVCHSELHKTELNSYGSIFKNVTVQGITYKKFIRDIIKTNIDILVLDVQGHECTILNTFFELDITELPKILCIECGYDWNERKQILLKLGYVLDFYEYNNCYLSHSTFDCKNISKMNRLNEKNQRFVWNNYVVYENELNRKIEINSAWHLGDNIINFIFFYKIKDFIESNGIIIHYYCHKKYHKNIAEFSSKNIRLFDYENKGHVLWQATVPSETMIEDQLCTMFNTFLRKYRIPITVNEFEYEDMDLFDRLKNLEQYKNVNVLVINSTPLSGQYNYNKKEWDDFIIKLSKKYTVATSQKVDGILSLEDISVKNIASVALHVKIIIAINTGPSLPLYNTHILNNIEAFYIFGGEYQFKTRKIKKMTNINDLSFLL